MTTTLADAPKKPRRLAPLMFLALTGALLAVLFTRYKAALAERTAYAEAAPSKPDEPSGPRLTAITHGVPIQWQPSLTLAGTLTPVHESNLSFKVSGRLASVDVETGAVVRMGQRLATLDVADAAAQVANANAQVHASEVELSIAKDSEQRSQALLSQGAVSDAQHRADTQHVLLAQARLEQAQAQAEAAITAQSNTRLVAPFAGRVTLAPSAPGAVVGPGATLLRIEDTSALRLRATLSIEDALLAKPGALLAIDGSRAVGHITAVLPSVDAQTRRVPVIAEITNDAASPLLAGVFVRATLSSNTAIPVIKLPAEVLRPGSQDELVVVEQGKARIVHVTFARGDGGVLLARAGVTERDAVVLAPTANLKTGDVLHTQAAP